jgi:hypothetical protein
VDAVYYPSRKLPCRRGPPQHPHGPGVSASRPAVERWSPHPSSTRGQALADDLLVRRRGDRPATTPLPVGFADAPSDSAVSTPRPPRFRVTRPESCRRLRLIIIVTNAIPPVGTGDARSERHISEPALQRRRTSSPPPPSDGPLVGRSPTHPPDRPGEGLPLRPDCLLPRGDRAGCGPVWLRVRTGPYGTGRRRLRRP